jgi:hypothetical protein
VLVLITDPLFVVPSIAVPFLVVPSIAVPLLVVPSIAVPLICQRSEGRSEIEAELLQRWLAYFASTLSTV